MPRILEQLQVPPVDISPVVEDASSILTEAFMYLFGRSDILDPNENDTVSEGTLNKRKWSCCKGISIKEIVDIVMDVVKVIPEAVVEGFSDGSCKVTAATTLGGYLAAFTQVKGQNPGPGIPVTDAHMYFLFQLYGYFPLTAGLRLHFNTRKFLGFIGSYDAITFARDIFIVADCKLSPRPGPEDSDFETVMTTIIHEIRHCQQYRSLGWSVPAFRAKYMYQWCRAGFKYRRLKFEEEAYTQDKMMNSLLLNPYGYMFFRYWRLRKLSSMLGYPVATTYRRQPGESEGDWELPFQYGTLLITFYTDDACWSYLTSAEAEARGKANNCRSFSGRCEPDTTTYEKAVARKKECLKDERL